MGCPKTVKRYNSMWFEIFDRFLEDDHKVVEIPCKSEQSAKALRLEFYKVRTAILGKVGQKPEDPELAKLYEEALNSREVKVKQLGERWFCVFDHRDHNWVGRLLQGAQVREGEN